MDIAVYIMIIDAKYIFAQGIPAFPAPWRGLYFHVTSPLRLVAVSCLVENLLFIIP